MRNPGRNTIVGFFLWVLLFPFRAEGVVDFYQFMGTDRTFKWVETLEKHDGSPLSKLTQARLEDDWGREFVVVTGDDLLLQTWVSFTQFFAAVGMPYTPLWPTVARVNADGTFSSVQDPQEGSEWKPAVIYPVFLAKETPAATLFERLNEDVEECIIGAGLGTRGIYRMDSGALVIPGDPLGVFRINFEVARSAEYSIRSKFGKKDSSEYSRISAGDELAEFQLAVSNLLNQVVEVSDHHLDSLFGPVFHNEENPVLPVHGYAQKIERLKRFLQGAAQGTKAGLENMRRGTRIALEMKPSAARAVVPEVRFLSALRKGDLGKLPSIADDVFRKQNAKHLLNFYFFYPPHRRSELLDKWRAELPGVNPVPHLIDVARMDDGTLRWVNHNMQGTKVPVQPMLNKNLKPSLLVMVKDDPESQQVAALADSLRKQGVPIRTFLLHKNREEAVTLADVLALAAAAKNQDLTRVLLWEPGISEEDEPLFKSAFGELGLELRVFDHHARKHDVDRDSAYQLPFGYRRGATLNRYSAIEQFWEATGYIPALPEYIVALMDRSGLHGIRQLRLSEATFEGLVAAHSNSRIDQIAQQIRIQIPSDAKVIEVSGYHRSLRGITVASDRNFPELNTLLIKEKHRLRVRGPAHLVDHVLDGLELRDDEKPLIGGDKGQLKYFALYSSTRSIESHTETAMRRLGEKVDFSKFPCAKLILGSEE